MNQIKTPVILSFFLLCFYVYGQEPVTRNFETFDQFLEEQNTKLDAVQNGLSEREVKQLLGSDILVKVPKVGRMKPLNKVFRQPYFLNKFKNKQGDGVVVLWYFSTPKDDNGVVSKRECTPVLVEKGTVVGKGWDFFNNYRRTMGLRM